MDVVKQKLRQTIPDNNVVHHCQQTHQLQYVQITKPEVSKTSGKTSKECMHIFSEKKFTFKTWAMKIIVYSP